MTMAKISVVMAVFNGAATFAATMASILEQTERDLEVIVVDDGSTDATPQLLRDFAARDSRIRVITQANTGLTRALIAGCAAAHAPLIARHDAGDLSHPQRMEKQAALFDESPELVFASSWVDFVGPELEYLHSARDRGITLPPAQILAPDRPAIIDGPSHHGSVMFRRDAYERVGGYRSEFYYGQDWDLWYRLAEVGLFARVPEMLYTARVLPASITTSARELQERLAQLSIAALASRRRGESDAPLVAEAATIRPVAGGNPRRRIASGLYFIGEALRRNGDPRARAYLRKAIAARPFWPRPWIRYIQSFFSKAATE